MIVSYHNHTNWSDGTATLAEMLAGAKQAGLDEFGISDHYVLPPDGQQFDWAMPLGFLDDYVATLLAAAKEVEGFILRIGVETDFYPETVETIRERLAPYPFDYLLGSVHAANDFLVDYRAEAWEPLTQHERNDIWALYWLRMRQMAESKAFDIVGHFDLPKKFSFLPTVDFTAEIHAALDAIADSGMAMEINTAGWMKPIAEAYPSEALLAEAFRRDIPIVINADAHRPQDVANLFDRARAMAWRVGYREQVRFDKRQRFTFPFEP